MQSNTCEGEGGERDMESISPTCLLKAFMPADPKSSNRQSSHQCFFALLSSLRV